MKNDSAIIHEKNIKDLSGKTGTAETQVNFNDGSNMILDLSNLKSARTNGTNDSQSYKFANDLANLTFDADKLELTFWFKDKSKIAFNLTGIVTVNRK